MCVEVLEELLELSLNVINALAVLVPGFILLGMLRSERAPVVKRLTMILALFTIVHGVYHSLEVFGLQTIADPIDFVSVLILVYLGVYYNRQAI